MLKMLIFFVGALLLSCPVSAEKLKVVTTTGMIGDLVRQVGGDLVEVQEIIAPGVDPHLFKPTRADILAMTSADVVFYNGLLLEGKMTDAFARIAKSGKAVIGVAERLPTDYLLSPPEFATNYDPHIWMDPLGWVQILKVIEQELTLAQPENSEYFKRNSEKFEGSIQELHVYINGVVSKIPEQRRILVTAHDAFNYFGRRYGLLVRGIQGLSTESEASVRDITDIVDLLVGSRVAAVFVESTVSERNINAIILGAKARGWNVKIGGQLYSDAMGPKGSSTGTYLGMLAHNAKTIAEQLSGQKVSDFKLGQVGPIS